jgi:hypothetical protein
MTARRGRRRKQVLDDIREKTECWKLKQEALYGSLCGELALERAVALP